MKIAPETGKKPVRIPSDRPCYKLTEPFFDPHDNWQAEGTIFKFDGGPNASMMPLNDLARSKYDEYMDRLDAGKRVYCEKQDPPIAFVPHERIYEEQDDDILDVSRTAAIAQPTEFKLGSRSRRGGVAAEVLN